MEDWYLMQSPNFHRGFETEDFHAYAQDGFEELLQAYPLSHEVMLYDTADFDQGVPTQAIIHNTTTDSLTNVDTRYVLSRIGTLRAGQYIEYREHFWLVASMPDNNEIYEKAIMLRCNHYLRWMNDSGQVVRRHCMIKDETKYTMGQNYKDYTLIVGETRMNLMLPRDEETLRLKRGKRFMISNSYHNPLVYSITKFDDVSDFMPNTYENTFENHDGIVRAICVETQFNPLTDNRELMIADYYPAPEPPEGPEPPTPVPDDPHIQITDPLGSFRISVGDVRTVEVTAYAVGQKLDTMLECELLRAAGIARIKSTSIGSITIQADAVVVNVGKSFVLRVWNTEHALEATQEFTIAGLMG